MRVLGPGNILGQRGALPRPGCSGDISITGRALILRDMATIRRWGRYRDRVRWAIEMGLVRGGVSWCRGDRVRAIMGLIAFASVAVGCRSGPSFAVLR